jgi:hypothetical protein
LGTSQNCHAQKKADKGERDLPSEEMLSSFPMYTSEVSTLVFIVHSAITNSYLVVTVNMTVTGFLLDQQGIMMASAVTDLFLVLVYPLTTFHIMVTFTAVSLIFIYLGSDFFFNSGLRSSKRETTQS